MAWQRAFVRQWVRSHDEDARALRKPVYLGEFSVRGGADRDTLYRDIFDEVEKSAHTAGALLCADRRLQRPD